ncbi:MULTISPECIES: SusC/RagA family TonB-linked outer membrane protein [unclassified Polaribacter]|uniref:SusC/RagA family TonB-linked outer membrane protein n=1 Tax=unclassified Polaribacter TaxID=196858 RepID=UPI0011BF92D5|nr:MULTISPECIES: TonB-dependent receptor [unclassified Polaribacter]TXD53146.1 TonB-dependent receptor [Polaribacter sp. IC063]TXD61266.1 TonB-dependent receptor [Polaribacter sp. IC066]
MKQKSRHRKSFQSQSFSLLVLVLIFFCFTGGDLIAQQITGTVVDASSMPIPGVSVMQKGTSNGAMTDFNGAYSLNMMSGEKILVFSSLGFKKIAAPIGSKTSINVTLEESNETLDEIVIVGYGTQKKSDLTGAVASLDKSRLEKVPNSNFAQALQGAIAGVSVVNTGGSAEGNEVGIIIRGRNSIRAGNGPLIVLDGIIYNGSISDINPTDIGSLEVLKDASSAAIYGTRGANGVILITSKKGVKGKTKIRYDGFTGVDEVFNLPDMLTSEEFYNFKLTRTPDAISQTEEDNFLNGTGTNWLDEALTAGFRQQHTLSVSGATEDTNFYISGSYLDVKGVALNDRYSRASLRINITNNIKDWLTFSTNSQLTYGDRSGIPATWSGNRGAYSANPLTNVRNENGDLTILPWPEENFFTNPLEGLLAKNQDESYKLFTNNFIEIKAPFAKGLSFKLNTGFTYTARNIATYYGINTGTGSAVSGRANTAENLEKNTLIENILNYERSSGKHKIFATGLYSYQRDISENNALQSIGFPSDVLTWYQSDVANLVTPRRSFSERVVLSYMLRLNYTFDRRYAITLTGRRDGYSGFGERKKFGDFPSVGFAWNADNESFLEDSEFINTLKLRLSYGINGNDAISGYERFARYTEFSYLNGGSQAAGYIPQTLGLNDLGWETTTSFNAGIDYGFLNNRITGSINGYKSKTTDLLLLRRISPINGETSIINNIGSVENQGLEFDINATILNKNDFKWNIAANFSYNENKIVDLYGNGEDDVLNQWFIGQPIRVNFAYQYDGVYQLGDDVANAPIPNTLPGHARVVDQNEDGAIDADDRVLLGQNDPKYFGGLNMTFAYKDVTLSIVSQGSFGATKINSLLADSVFAETQLNTANKNWWTPDNPTNDFYANDIDANPRGVRIYENADYWRIRDVTLSYSLPNNIADAVGLSNLNVYFTGRNLVTFTKFGGLDPEFSSDTDIPLQRTFTLGLNLSL